MNWDALKQFDRDLLLVLNGSESLFWDGVMTAVTSTLTWIPLTVVLLYVLFKNNSVREVVLIVLMIALAIAMADQFASSFCKPYFARLRPTQDPALMNLVDVVNGYRGGRYGFISSHAANTFALTVYLSLLIRNRALTVSLLCWACLCSYSRIYLGVHYPGDILFGTIWGCFVGIVVYRLYLFFAKRYSLSHIPVSTQYTPSGYLKADIHILLSALYLTYIYAPHAGYFLLSTCRL